MNALILDHNLFGMEDVYDTFTHLNISFDKLIHDNIFLHTDASFDEYFAKCVSRRDYDFVFSLNYYPILSHNCKKYGLKYVSLIYDSPHIALYTYTITFDCNYIFIFDHAMYAELKTGGIDTVYYMPLPANVARLDRLTENVRGYDDDISFTGSLYNEKHNLYDRLYDKLKDMSAYACGRLDALIDVQSRMYGNFILENLLDDNLLETMYEAMPYDASGDSIATRGYVYAHYFMARKATELERKRILTTVAGRCSLSLYTHNRDVQYDGMINKGSVDYYNQMPIVFKKSRINLNITLKSIRTGIPLRCIDIMAAGGFLLTNWQEDMLKHFEPDVDFVFYTDDRDLLEKAEYYLSHDSEREEIARNGYNKIKRNYTYSQAVVYMLQTADILPQ